MFSGLDLGNMDESTRKEKIRLTKVPWSYGKSMPFRDSMLSLKL